MSQSGASEYRSDAPIIALDHESTWPPDVLKLLELNSSLLHLEIKHATKSALMTQLDAALMDHEIVAYQCTRLQPDEISKIQSEGLLPLSSELNKTRIQKRVDAGDFTPEVAARLLAKNLAGKRGRSGLLHLTLTVEVLGKTTYYFFAIGEAKRYISHSYTTKRLARYFAR